ncbi:O-antigen ligase family protein [Mesobacillus subterraneus]|uniref:O-antigen ligase family protein n=1 Tax=Mesobacillus subterraneus TaxID=285983 RepID=UPI001CFC79C9|nr:O-antigen ligase family protein [Mesobacillus subterraneus]
MSDKMLRKIEGIDSKILKIIIFLLLIYSFFGYLFPENIIFLMLIFASLAIILNLVIEKRRIVTVKQLILLCLIILFVLVLIVPASYSLFPESSINVSFIRSVILIVGFLISLQGNWYEKGLKVILIFSMIHILATFFSYLFPNFFLSFIVPFLPSPVGVETTKFMLDDMYAGITDQIGRNAFYISVGIATLYSYFVIKTNKLSKFHILFLFIFMGISLLTLLLTGKRGHLVANLFSMLFITSVYTKIKGKSILLKLSIVVIIIIAFLYFLTYLFPETAAPFLRFIERQGGDQTSGRMELYIYALELFIEKPLMGWGVGVFSNLYGMGNHNIYLQLLSENGLIGFTIFSTIIIFNLFCTTSGLKSNYYSGVLEYNKFFLFSLYIQVFFIIYGLTGNPLSDGFILIIYMIASSIPYTLNTKGTSKKT